MFINWLGTLPNAAAQGMIWGMMAIGVYITYRILDIADLTVDGSICTGGLIAKRLTDVPGSSDIFVGTVVSYANQVKEKVLGVPGNLLEILGPVCAPVAECMAVGARNVLGCDIAVATTGLAGPGDDDRGNPEGLVYVALATAERTYVRKFRLGRGRDRVRVMAASYALDMLRRVINGLPLLGEE